MLALAFSAMTFTSCEDVPAPYAYPEAEGDGVFLNTTFANSLSPWTSYVTEGEDGLHWKNAYSSAVCTGSWDPAASAASNSPAKARVNHAGKAWLVSPTLDLSGVEEAFVSFDHAIAFERTAEIFNHHVLMYSTEYQQGNEPGSATWRRVDFDYGTADHTGGNYNFEQTGANLTPEMLVDGITFAFVYESTTQNASTWEVKNFLCMKGQYQSQGGGGGEGEVFKQATGVTSGQTYAFVASSDNKFYAATALTGTYGYLPQAEVQIVDGEMNAKDEMKFTFTKVDGGYTIQDADGQYLYMTGTYNSFNRSADVPAEGGHIWSVSFNENGTVNVVNVAKSKTIQYSAQHTSWGSYEAVSNILPMLFTNGDTSGESGGGGGGGGTGEKGTADNPYTVAEALDIINGMADGATGTTDVYVKGKLTADASTWYFNSSYGQCNYYISDDGSSNNTIYVYNGKDLNNTDFTATRTYKQGSDVVIVGKLQKFVKDGAVTPELARGNYIVSITEGQGGGGGDTPTGHGYSADDPLSVAEALEIIDALPATGGSTDNEMFVKGKIASEFSFSSQYSNCNYYIADNGQGDNTQLYVYAGNDVDNQPFTAAPDYALNSTVIIKGKLQKFVKNGTTTPEISKGNYIVSIDQSGGGGGGGGGETYTVTKSVDEENLIVTFTVQGMTPGGYYDANLIDGQIAPAHQTANPVVEMNNGLKFTFAKGDGTTEPKRWCSGNYDEYRMYAKNTLTIENPDDGYNIAKVELQCTKVDNQGTVTKYIGNEQAYATSDGKNLTIVNDFTQPSAGTQLRITSARVWYNSAR